MTMKIEEVENNIDLAVNLLKALSNESRLKIMCALYKCEKNVGDLEGIVGLGQSALSQHLARLRKDGLVSTRRDAQTIYYSMSDDATEAVLHCLYGIYCNDGDSINEATSSSRDKENSVRDIGSILFSGCETHINNKK